MPKADGVFPFLLRIWPVRAGSVRTGSAVRAGSVRAGSRFVSVRVGSVLAVPVRFVGTLLWVVLALDKTTRGP